MAERWFLKIDGIVGDSIDESHKDEIDVLSWSWGVTQTGGNSGAGASGGSGGGAGKATFEDFHFVSRIGKASPKLFLASATGSHHKTAALSGVRVGGKGPSNEFLKYKLSDVVVTSDQHAGDQADFPVEEFSLSYSKIEISYTPQTATGAAGTAIKAGFDVKANKKI